MNKSLLWDIGHAVTYIFKKKSTLDLDYISLETHQNSYYDILQGDFFVVFLHKQQNYQRRLL